MKRLSIYYYNDCLSTLDNLFCCELSCRPDSKHICKQDIQNHLKKKKTKFETIMDVLLKAFMHIKFLLLFQIPITRSNGFVSHFKWNSISTLASTLLNFYTKYTDTFQLQTCFCRCFFNDYLLLKFANTFWALNFSTISIASMC